jgi:hypothetical protein
MRVQAALNSGRAMTLCWSANSPSSRASISSAMAAPPCVGVSIDFGTRKSPTKPTAYRNDARKTT